MAHSAFDREYIQTTRSVLLTEISDRDRFKAAGAEPRLSDVLRDPIVHLVMKRDQVTLADLHNLVGRYLDSQAY